LEQHESDASDLVQDVFALLVAKLPQFAYRPEMRFRGWLWTVTRNRWRERKRRRSAATMSGSAIDHATVSDSTEDFDDDEYHTYVVNRCLQLMQCEFKPITWKACWAYVVEDRPAAEVATELGITVNAVHLAKSRVLRRLREELKGLLD
jgi:RNA polymerase sigma-70 factor (ECF subfamily)